MKLRFSLFALIFFPLALLAQYPVCIIDGSNQNQDFCTACSGNISNGVFTGYLDVYVPYTIDANCLSGISFGEFKEVWIDRGANLIYGGEPTIEPNTDVNFLAAHHRHSGFIRAYNEDFYPRARTNGRSYNDLALQMEAAGNANPDRGVGDGGGGDFALPIKLNYWSVGEHSGAVLLSWGTVIEDGNDFFAIQHSQDGLRFREIARVIGAGDSATPLDYSFRHLSPAAGDNYYRLVQVDLSGESTTYDVLYHASTRSAAAGIYPNPARPGQDVRLSARSNEAAELIGGTGRLVRTYAAGQRNLALPADLTPGIYLLRRGARTERLLVR